MIPDSMNPRQMAENILELQRQINEAGSEVPTPGVGDTGKIIKVGSSGYELSTDYATVNYSAVEKLTGRKWNDGKDVYEITIIGNTPSETGSATLATIGPVDTVVHLFGSITGQAGLYSHLIERALDIGVGLTDGQINATFSNTSYTSGTFNLTILYTKSDPTPDVVPSPDNDTRSVESIEEVTEEPVQETKTTRKRSTSSK